MVVVLPAPPTTSRPATLDPFSVALNHPDELGYDSEYYIRGCNSLMPL